MEGQRREGAGRTTRLCPKEARAVQAPAGGAPGERTQGGKGDDGSHAACPLPCRGASAAPRACAVLAMCIRRRTDSAGAPPPNPLLPHPPRKGARTARRWRGDRGGGQRTDRRARGRDGRQAVEKEKTTTTNKANQRARGRKREDGDQNRGERGEAGVTWARMGRW